MSYLVANVPSVQCFVRREYLRDLTDSFGEYDECFWVTTKSIQNRALYFESYICEYGALFDKLPISAFVWKTKVDTKELLPLCDLQYWDCLSYNISVTEKRFLKHLNCKIWLPNGKFADGEYLFTIDTCHSNPQEINCTFSETPNEHKSFNIIKLDNGQFAAYPNNRIIWENQSLTPQESKIPKFKTSTKYFFSEEKPISHSDSDEFFYEKDLGPD